MTRRIGNRKYAEAIMFFITECQNAYLGGVKLRKLLYYLDFDHYERYGRSVTGDLYRKWQHGPVGVMVNQQIKSLARNGSIRHLGPDEANGRHVYRAERGYDLSIFGPTEIEMLWIQVDRWKHVPTDDIRLASHLDAPWRLTKYDNTIIPYEYVHLRHQLPENEQPESREAIRRAAQESAGSDSALRFSRELSDVEKEALFNFIVGSEELEGVKLDANTARRIFEEAIKAPLLELR